VAETDHFLSGANRLAWAYHYIKTLESEADTWLKGNIYSLDIENDANNQPVLKVTRVDAPPVQIGTLIGNALHNMRSCLDHFAFGLVATNHGRRRIPKEIETTSAFPIFNSGPKFRRRIKKGAHKGLPAPGSGLYKISGIDPLAQTEIERLQPYHRRKLPEARVLWMLEQLSWADKHRAPPLTLLNLLDSRITVEFEGARLRKQVNLFGRLKKNAVIARWEVDFLANQGQMKVNPQLKLAIAFGKGAWPDATTTKSAGEVLADMWNFINNEVRPRLAQFLPEPARQAHSRPDGPLP
jgi:hypothetical protein